MDQLADANACHGGHRVLVVDDNRSVREPLVTLLEGRGFSARGVGNGREALQTLRDGFDACLILLDLTMPIVAGVRVCELIHHLDRSRYRTCFDPSSQARSGTGPGSSASPL